MRLSASLVRAATCGVLIAAAGCAHRTDLRGRNAAARAWVEQERRAQALSPPPAASQPHGIATPDARAALPEHIPPPRRPAPQRVPPGTSARPSAASPSPGAHHRVGVGTCFAIDTRGTLVTAQHVIAGARRIAVRLADGTIVDASLLRASSATDVALLRIEHPTANFLALDDHHGARVGAPVFTVGYPEPDLLGTEPKFTDGSISALSGIGGEAAALQMTVPIQPGNSGGPLLTNRATVVGVVVARASDAAFFEHTGTLPQNVNFASKVDNVRTLMAAAPQQTPPARDRAAAVERALRAVCLVLAVE
jgi:serine protease Do